MIRWKYRLYFHVLGTHQHFAILMKHFLRHVEGRPEAIYTFLFKTYQIIAGLFIIISVFWLLPFDFVIRLWYSFLDGAISSTFIHNIEKENKAIYYWKFCVLSCNVCWNALINHRMIWKQVFFFVFVVWSLIMLKKIFVKLESLQDVTPL